MIEDGDKRALGLTEGTTENFTVADDLLQKLDERGIHPNRKYLFVIDGSKALRKAIDSVFG